MRVGSFIRFKEEKQKYKIMARNDRYMICTKPFNLKNTVLYTIVDLEGEKRGTENLVFGLGAETKQDCEDMLKRISSFETEISHRNRIELDIEELIFV